MKKKPPIPVRTKIVQQRMDRALDFVRRAGDEGITASDLASRMNENRIQVSWALSLLQQEGLATCCGRGASSIWHIAQAQNPLPRRVAAPPEPEADDDDLTHECDAERPYVHETVDALLCPPLGKVGPASVFELAKFV